MKFKIILPLLLLVGFCNAQTSINLYRNNLSKLVTFNIKKQKVKDALQQISTAGDFYFSYNGKLINQDSLVTMNVKRMPVREVLEQMFNGKVDYKESSEYVILRYAVNHFNIEPENITTADNLFLISGYIIDTETGKKVKNASVYEKRLLKATLTDDNGYFTLRFKGDYKEVTLTASKETYRDTALVFLADINISPKTYNDPDKEKGTNFFNVIEELGIAKFLISSKQRIQNLNISSFFADNPFQASFTPGLSSHGIMSSRVINRASLNVLGGYTAGVSGVEVGGLFNLSIGNVNFFQTAGLLNAVGGNVKGFQVAGLHNYVKYNVNGLQTAGLVNMVKGDFIGLQVSGIANVVHKKIIGTQVAGIINVVGGNIKGAQIAGIANVANKNFSGTQIAGIFNYAKHNKGLQIGLVNLADTSTGTSIGLLNLSKNGYHKINLFTNDLINTNIALKTGNANLYTLLIAGKNYSDTAKIETLGIGLGHDFKLNKTFSVATEIITQYLHLGRWNDANMLLRLQANLQITLFKNLSVFAGPSYAYYNSHSAVNSGVLNYKQQIIPKKHHSFSNNNKGWWGFNVGISFF